MDVVYIPRTAAGGSGGGSGGGASPQAVAYRIVEPDRTGGVAALLDRAVNRVQLEDGESVRLVFPVAVDGYARDFYVRLVVRSEEMPELTFAAQDGEEIDFERDSLDELACEPGVNLLAFTETEAGVFTVKRRFWDIPVPVEFDGNGGEPATQTVEYRLGSLYGSFPSPRREGFYLDGWYTEAEGGSKVSPAGAVSLSLAVLHARWEALPSFDELLARIAPGVAGTTGGDAEWTVDAYGGEDGRPCLRSGAIPAGAQSWLRFTVEGSGELRFRCRASTEAWTDNLEVYVDECYYGTVTGETGWGDYAYSTWGEGPHVIELRYQKWGSGAGDDRIRVSAVSWTPEGGS